MRRKINSVLFMIVALSALSCAVMTVRGFDVPVETFKLGNSAKWQHNAFMITYTVEIFLRGQTTGLWLVDYFAKISMAIPALLAIDTIGVFKDAKLGGFSLTEDGDYWGLWINPENVTVSTPLTIPGRPVGFPIWIPEGITYEAEEGIMDFGGEIWKRRSR